MRAVLVTLVAAAACGKGPPEIDPSPSALQIETADQNPPPQPDAAPKAAATPDAVTMTPEDPKFFAPRVLAGPPVTDGKPPQKTTAVIPNGKLEALAAIDVPGWEHDPAGVVDHVAILSYKTAARPTVVVEIEITPCKIEGKEQCLPMDLATWQLPANAEKLAAGYPDAARFAADPTAAKQETGTIALGGGATAIFEYHLGFLALSTDIRGRAKTFASYAYSVMFDDGMNAIRVTARYADVTPADVATLTTALPKDQLAAAARGYFQLMTSGWQQ